LIVKYLFLFISTYQHSAVAHILTHTVNLAFGRKPGFKNTVNVGLGPGRFSKWGRFYNSAIATFMWSIHCTASLVRLKCFRFTATTGLLNNLTIDKKVNEGVTFEMLKYW